MAAGELNTGVAHSARIYDYLLGGKDNFEADRTAAAAITEALPHMPTSMRANRDFMTRTAGFLAEHRGIRQFLDIGTGIPTEPNLHQVVQQIEPASRVVYVDKDPIVLAHARALLTSTPQGRTAYLDADMHRPKAILSSPEVTDTLDLNQPVALSLIAVLQFVLDDLEADRIVSELLEPLAPGSTLTISTATIDNQPDQGPRAIAAYKAGGIVTQPRTRAEVAALFDGLDLLPPGVVLVHQWRPAGGQAAVPDEHVYMYGGVAVKP